jgi:hypothetical protein
VAELRDVLSRTVAWLPAGMVAATAHDARANSMTITIDLFKFMACLQLKCKKSCAQLSNSFGCCDDFNAVMNCYTLSAENRRN